MNPLTYDDDDSLVSWAEICDLELVIVRRMQEHGTGIHPSLFRGSGHDLASLRDWQPGDRLSTIDWPQSSLTNFSPLVAREFDQESNASVIVAADVSASTRCGPAGDPLAKTIARTVATFVMAAAFFQDRAGLVTFDRTTRRIAVRPKVGKNHAMHCVEAYQTQLLGHDESASTPSVSFSGLLRKRSLVPVLSDFLIAEPAPLLAELADLNSAHDVFLVLIDAAFAFEFPPVSAGWVESYDVETGESRMLSQADVRELGRRVSTWQDDVEQHAREHGLEVLRLNGQASDFHDTVVQFLFDRKQQRR